MSKILLLVGLLVAMEADKDDILDQIRFYEIEVATDPNYENLYQYGIYRLVQDDLDRSIAIFERIKKVKPEAHYHLGIAYYQKGEYERAALNFEQFRTVNRDLWQPCYYLSLINLKLGRVDRAMHYLQQIPGNEEKRDFTSLILDYQRLDEARISFAEKRYEDALELYDEVNDFFGYREMGLALTYAELGRYEESLALLDTVINCSTDAALMRSGLYESGKQLVKMKHLSKAKQYLREYLKISPDNNARFLMGSIFSDEGRLDSARLYFNNLPDSVDAFLFYQGRTEYFLGFWHQAEIRLLRHRERFPGSRFADRTLYILASINFKRKEYRDAITFWRELVDEFPMSIYAASALAEIGHSYFNLGDYGSALNAYKSVGQYDPSEEIAAEVTLRLYETKYYLHRKPSLVEVLRQYIRENPDARLVSKTRLRIAMLLYDRKQYYQSLSEIDGLIDDYADHPVAIEAMMLRVRVSQALENNHELINSLRSLLLNENAGEYQLFAANELAGVWVDLSAYDSALYYYNLLLTSDTYRENSILKIANIYELLGQTKESIAMVERLISEYPKSIYLADAYMLQSRALKSQGDYGSALEMLRKISEKITDRAELFMELGNLYFDVEEFAAARNNFIKACEIFKQNREDAAQALLRAGDASVMIGDEKSGKEYYLKASMMAESSTLKNQAMQKLTSVTED